MNAFLITFMVIGLIELIGAVVYAITGVVPKRTQGGAVFNGLIMGGFGFWAAFLYFS